MQSNLNRFTNAVLNKNISEINEILETVDNYRDLIFWYFCRSNIVFEGCEVNYSDILLSAFISSPGSLTDNFSRLIFDYINNVSDKAMMETLILKSPEKLLFLVEQPELYEQISANLQNCIYEVKQMLLLKHYLFSNNVEDVHELLSKNSKLIFSKILKFENIVIDLLVKMLELPTFYDIIIIFIQHAMEFENHQRGVKSIMKILRGRILPSKFNAIKLVNRVQLEEKRVGQILSYTTLFPNPIMALIRSFTIDDLAIAFQECNLSLAWKIIKVAIDDENQNFISRKAFKMAIFYNIPNFAIILLDYLLSPDNIDYFNRAFVSFFCDLETVARKSKWNAVFLRLLIEKIKISKIDYRWYNFFIASAIADNNYQRVASLFEIGFAMNVEFASCQIHMNWMPYSIQIQASFPSRKMARTLMIHASLKRSSVNINQIFNDQFFLHQLSAKSCTSESQTKLKSRVIIMLLQCVDLDILYQKDKSGFTIEENFNQTIYGDQRIINKFTKKLAALRKTHEHSCEVGGICRIRPAPTPAQSMKHFDYSDTDALRIGMFG